MPSPDTGSHSIHAPVGHGEHRSTSALRAFYDLAVSPTSYDFAVFLARAEQARIKYGLPALRVIIVPAPGDGFWECEPHPWSVKRRRLDRLLVPLCDLWPNIADVTVCALRAEGARIAGEETHRTFPSGYSVARPIEDAYQWAHLIAAFQCGDPIPAWQAPAGARADVARWLCERAHGRTVVTITLRESAAYPEVNSDLEAWGEFARSLDADRYLPVIVRDTEADPGLPPPALSGITPFEGASDVALRAALYESADLNMGTASGPMMLCWLRPDLPYLVFRMFRLGSRRSTPMAVRALGLEIGGQLVVAGPRQRIVWEEETPEGIGRAFREIEPLPRARHKESGTKEAPSPENAEPPLVTARRLRETGRFEPARRIYHHIVQRGESAAWFGLSMLELETPRRPRLKRYCQAGFAFLHGQLTGAKSVSLSTVQALEAADAYRRWRLVERARRLYSAILKSDSHCAAAWHGLGAIALQLGQLEAAADALGRAVDLEPSRARFQHDFADALAALGRNDEAVKRYRSAALSDPSDAEAARRYEALTGSVVPYFG